MINRTAATISHVKILHALGAKVRRGRIPKQKYPKLIENEYAIAMIAHVDHARAALTPLLHALPAALGDAQKARNDALELADLIEIARRALETSTAPSAVEALARKFGQRTQDFNKVQLGRQVRAALGADVFGTDKRIAARLDHFVQENAALIKSIPHNVIDQVEGLVNRAVTSGQQHGDLADEIEERFDVGESRARLIARDQVGKLYGQTNAYRQQDLGITQFIWRTSEDERVRPEHEDLDGETFSYDDPPDEGLPGEPIQCRCSAEPVFVTLRDGVDSEDNADT